jgi:hypothetical protein
VNKHNDLVVCRRMDALERNGWNISRAARQLGLTTQWLKGFLDARGLQFPRLPSGRRPRTVQVRPTKFGLEKRCVRCREWLPLTAEVFSRQQLGAFGFANQCKACAYAREAERRAAKRRAL